MNRRRQREMLGCVGGINGQITGYVIATDRKAAGFQLFDRPQEDRCVGVHVFKAGRRRHYTKGSEMELTLEEAMDFGLQLVLMCMAQPNAKKRYDRWVKRGKTRSPPLEIVRGRTSLDLRSKPPVV
ncbi:MAG: hypothetical protein M3O46_23560 [Myxococcota bacterium]|nr:hypothetical protein [Myxococcota bacterium]